MNGQTTSDDHRHGWTPSSVLHMLGSAREFWSSDLNRAVEPSTPARGALRLRRLWQRSRAVIDIRQGAAESLPVRTASIDRAYSVNAAHHFDDIPLAISELARVLKPGGRLLLVEEDFTSEQHPYHSQESFPAHDPVDAVHIVNLLTDAGLSTTQVDHQPIAGLTATVITATAPGQRQPSESTSTRDNTGESS